MPFSLTNAPMGSGLPLCYGYVWTGGLKFIDWNPAPLAWEPDAGFIVGQCIIDPAGNTQQCTTPGVAGYVRPTWEDEEGDTTDDNEVVWTNIGHGLQYGARLLGEGEWDGFNKIINKSDIGWEPCALAYGYDGPGTYIPNGPDPPTISFHPGTDTPVGSTLTPVSTGGDQLVDLMYASLPGGVQPQTFSGIAYYFWSWQVPSWLPGAVFDPIGVWRGIKCRIFDDMGNQVGYEWTRNAAWQWVDLWLRRAILPRSEYYIDSTYGIQAIDSVAQNCFDWGAVYEWSQDLDYILANGRKRFETSFAFTSPATVTALEEQILLATRSYRQEYAGKLIPAMDKPRASVFLLTGTQLAPGTIEVDDKDVHSAATDYTGNFLDVGVPAIGEIESIVNSSTGYGGGGGGTDLATFTTVEDNPIQPLDNILVGGNDVDAFNQMWLVVDVTTDPTTGLSDTFTAHPYVAIGVDETGTGGEWGFCHTRFAKRAPHIVHNQAAAARGQIGP